MASAEQVPRTKKTYESTNHSTEFTVQFTSLPEQSENGVPKQKELTASCLPFAREDVDYAGVVTHMHTYDVSRLLGSKIRSSEGRPACWSCAWHALPAGRGLGLIRVSVL